MATNSITVTRHIVWGLVAAGILWVLLACGPAAPYQESRSNSLVSGPESGATTETPGRLGRQSDGESDTSDTLPTKPPPDPTNTPFPTLAPDPPGVEEEMAREMARQRAARNLVEPSLAEQTTEFTREKLGKQYDYIVRAEVTAHRLVEPNTDITWPDESFSPPYMLDEDGEYAAWRRSELEISATYQGSLPENYELLAPAFLPNDALDVGQEYILFIGAAYVAEDEFTDRPGKHHLNAEQLEAFGGRGGFARLDHAWAVEGDIAWRLPRAHFMSPNSAPGLPAAKASGERLSVTALVTAINKGLGKK